MFNRVFLMLLLFPVLLSAEDVAPVTNLAIPKPIPGSEPVFPAFLSFTPVNGLQIKVGSNTNSVSYIGKIAGEGRIPGSPFGLNFAAVLAPDLGFEVGARLYFPGPVGPYFGVRGAFLFSYHNEFQLYGTAGAAFGWKFLLDGRDSRGGSFFLEPEFSLDGEIVDFTLYDPARTNSNGFFVRDMRPSLSIGLGYMFH